MCYFWEIPIKNHKFCPAKHSKSNVGQPDASDGLWWNGKALLGRAADTRLHHRAPGPVGFWFEATDATNEHSPPHPLRPHFI